MKFVPQKIHVFINPKSLIICKERKYEYSLFVLISFTIAVVEMKGNVKNEINCMDFDYTYTRFCTAGKDLNIRIYDANTNEVTLKP